MAYAVMAYVVIAYVVIADVAIAYVVMAYIVMAGSARGHAHRRARMDFFFASGEGFLALFSSLPDVFLLSLADLFILFMLDLEAAVKASSIIAAFVFRTGVPFFENTLFDCACASSRPCIVMAGIGHNYTRP